MSIFSKVQKTHVKKNKFDLTHDRKLSTKMGQLTPFCLLDVVPGDKFNIKSSAMVRFAPLIAPVMHKVSVYMHYFFVPHRLVFDKFEDFISGGENGLDNTVYPHFNVEAAYLQRGKLCDYLGLPTDDDISSNPKLKFSAIPHLTYAKIWNEYYRDQNLQTPLTDNTPGGEVNLTTYIALNELKLRSWQHDYFTSALPWTQKGPEAMLPLADKANVKLHELSNNPPSNRQLIKDVFGDPIEEADLGTTFINELWDNNTASFPEGQPAWFDPNDTLYADLSGATQTSINDLRKAFKLQEWLEKNARGGSRYTESILVHFGVHSSDKRLQRPEYIGGSSAPVKISEVLQTAETNDSVTPQGNMAGHAVSIGSGDKISYFAEEHGYIMGIMSIMPMSSYQQGIPKHFLRRDKFDYYWPEFANLGEQAIENQELWIGNSLENNHKTFGYTPRYSEYKYINNSVHGDYRQSLDFWHLGRKFDSRPALNSDFIEMNPNEVSRIFAVEDGTDNMWCHVLNDVTAIRPMPVFGTPKF